METGVSSLVESVLTESYGRLLAYLVSRSGDVAGAEDALSEAFLVALQTWEREGIPQKPAAWLLTVARHRIVDDVRRSKRLAQILHLLPENMDSDDWETVGEPAFPDERLKLLFLCAHPAIDLKVQTPLLLQLVLGVDVMRIASVFLVSPAAMNQRLVRAKAKIRDARLRFDVPAAPELPARLGTVLEAIYAAYGAGWEDVTSAEGNGGFAKEAIYLARLVTRLLPTESEAQGLLSLLLFCEARRQARRDQEGNFVPLSAQDWTTWDTILLQEAEQGLFHAAKQNRLGRFQLEAAIQSAHCQQIIAQQRNAVAIELLYSGLLQVAPTIGACTAYAMAIAESRGAAQGLTFLGTLPSKVTPLYQPYWVGKATLLARLYRWEDACDAYQQAIGLTGEKALRDHLVRLYLQCQQNASVTAKSVQSDAEESKTTLPIWRT